MNQEGFPPLSNYSQLEKNYNELAKKIKQLETSSDTQFKALNSSLCSVSNNKQSDELLIYTKLSTETTQQKEIIDRTLKEISDLGKSQSIIKAEVSSLADNFKELHLHLEDFKTLSFLKLSEEISKFYNDLLQQIRDSENTFPQG